MNRRRRAIRRTRPQELVGHMLLDVFVLLQLILLASMQLLLLQMELMLFPSSRLREPGTTLAKAPRDGLAIQWITLEVGQRCIASTMSDGTSESLPPTGQLHAQTPALVRIRCEAVAVAEPIGTLAHIHVARGDVVLGIKSIITVTKYLRIAQRAAIEVLCTLVARRLWHKVLLGPGARLGPTHLP